MSPRAPGTAALLHAAPAVTGVRRSALRKPGAGTKQLAPRLRSFTGAPSPLGNGATAVPLLAADAPAAAPSAGTGSMPVDAAETGSMGPAAAPALAECAADGALDMARLQARTRTQGYTPAGLVRADLRLS